MYFNKMILNNSKTLSSLLNVQKFITIRAKLNLKFLSSGPASKDGIEETAKMYVRIATKYHKLLDLHTLGFHRIWRKAIVSNIEIGKGTKILDAPSGTGLNALRILEKSKHLKFEPDFSVTMFDINPIMLGVGQSIFKKRGYDEKFVNFVEGDLHKLPFEAESFDIVISSLANRPFVDYSLVLKEVNRVLKSQGKIIILDYCVSEKPTIMQRLFYNYIKFIASKIEKLIFDYDLDAADFVTKSIRYKIAKSDVQQMLKDANFEKINFKHLSLGIAILTVAIKK